MKSIKINTVSYLIFLTFSTLCGREIKKKSNHPRKKITCSEHMLRVSSYLNQNFSKWLLLKDHCRLKSVDSISFKYLYIGI